MHLIRDISGECIQVIRFSVEGNRIERAVLARVRRHAVEEPGPDLSESVVLPSRQDHIVPCLLTSVEPHD